MLEKRKNNPGLIYLSSRNWIVVTIGAYVLKLVSE